MGEEKKGKKVGRCEAGEKKKKKGKKEGRGERRRREWPTQNRSESPCGEGPFGSEHAGRILVTRPHRSTSRVCYFAFFQIVLDRFCFSVPCC